MMKTFDEIFENAENIITGIAAAPGLVIAKAYKFIKEELEVNGQKITNIKHKLKSLTSLSFDNDDFSKLLKYKNNGKNKK